VWQLLGNFGVLTAIDTAILAWCVHAFLLLFLSLFLPSFLPSVLPSFLDSFLGILPSLTSFLPWYLSFLGFFPSVLPYALPSRYPSIAVVIQRPLAQTTAVCWAITLFLSPAPFVCSVCSFLPSFLRIVLPSFTQSFLLSHSSSFLHIALPSYSPSSFT
jgi:hypothetical protein